jgi:hypothetical protein
MSCCGNKRAQLAQPQAQTRRPDIPASVDLNTQPAPRSPRIFEYLGNQTMVLRGVVTGTTYHFSHSGDCLEVLHEDSFAMLAEREILLKI